MVLIALSLLLRSMTIDLSRGDHLYGSCQAAVRMLDEPNSAQTKSEMPSSTYCFGYVGRYIDALKRLNKEVCLDTATLNSVVHVYVGYMQKNPKLMDEERGVGLLLSLLSSYPLQEVIFLFRNKRGPLVNSCLLSSKRR